MIALAHLGTAVEHIDRGRTLVTGIAVEMDLGLAAFGEAEAEAHVLHPDGEAPTPNQILLGGRQRGHGRNGTAGPSGPPVGARSAQASMISGRLTPAGRGTWVMPMLPSPAAC
ncbi:MAG: hypothetical protein R2695_18730 [Acidimicrobiales bacterium]